MTDVKTAEGIHRSFFKQFNWHESSATIEESSKNGLSWKVQFSTKLASFHSFNKIDNCIYFTWKFEWDEAALKEQGFDGYEGEVVAEYKDRNNLSVRLSYQVQLIHPGQEIRRRIGADNDTKCTQAQYGLCRSFKMEFSLKKFSFEAKSVTSNFNDAVLVVEGNKINVNKKYLSLHSEYFDKLFNSKFKEKSMTEIPINDVNYADFARLLNTIHPTHPVLPTDENIETLLDLADRFMFPVVVERVINHLRYSSDLPFEDFLQITDKYKMDKIWELILKMINSGPRMQLLTKNIKCKELSETAKVKLFNRFAEIINICSFPNASVF